MNKTEAIKVLFEVNDKCKTLLNCVSTQQPSSQIIETANGYQIKMKCHITQSSRKNIQPILNKHKLGMREEKGFVTLSKLSPTCAQTQVS